MRFAIIVIYIFSSYTMALQNLTNNEIFERLEMENRYPSYFSFPSSKLLQLVDPISYEIMSLYCGTERWSKDIETLDISDGAKGWTQKSVTRIFLGFDLQLTKDQEEFQFIKQGLTFYVLKNSRPLSAWRGDFRSTGCRFSAVAKFNYNSDLKPISEAYTLADGRSFERPLNPLPPHSLINQPFPGQPLLAIVDSGINYLNPAWVKNLTSTLGYDYADNDDRPFNPWSFAHGNLVTHVAISMSPTIKIISIRRGVPNAGECFEDIDVRAIERVAEIGAKVVNLSWGGISFGRTPRCPNRMARLRSTFQQHPDIVFVVAAGNDRVDHDKYSAQYGFREPAWPDLDNVIVVGAVDSNNTLSDYSDFGKSTVHLGAQGNVTFFSEFKQNETEEGTSFAAPRVAATVIDMLKVCPQLNPTQLRKLILDTTNKSEQLSNRFISGGTLDYNKAVKAAQQTCSRLK